MTPAALTQLADAVARAMGLFFPPHRHADLERGFRLASAQLGHADPALAVLDFISAPLTPVQIEALAQHLTTGETHFFRHAEVFEALRRTVLPAALRQAQAECRPLRVWSTGCCSGEELYSVAMVLDDMGVSLEPDRVFLLGTDIAQWALDKARAATFGEWSFRGAPPDLRLRYFEPCPGQPHHRVISKLTQAVHFRTLNLVVDNYPQDVDVVLCRNVLIYFSDAVGRLVTARLLDSVRPGGFLIVGACEGHLPCELGLPPHADCPVIFELGTCTEMWCPRPPVDAVEAVEQPVEVDATGALQQVRALADGGQLVEAEAHCRAALLRHVEQPELHYLLGTILQEQGREEDAILAHRRALQLDRDHLLAMVSAGLLLGRRGQRREALQYYRRAAGLLHEPAAAAGLPPHRWREIREIVDAAVHSR